MESEEVFNYLDHDPLNGEPKFEPAKPEKLDLGLVIWPDKSLRHPVAAFPEENLRTRLVKNTAGAMIKTMYKYQGVGLAAQQVGVPFQIFVMDSGWHNEGAKKHPRIFINPRVTEVGEGAIQLPRPGEGCLSFPYDYHQPVARVDKLELEWLDTKGEVHHEDFEGYDAIIIQHELDHLAGYCFIDRLSPLKRDMALRRARKMRRRYASGYKKMIKSMKHAPHTREYQIKRQMAFEAGVRAGKEAACE